MTSTRTAAPGAERSQPARTTAAASPAVAAPLADLCDRDPLDLEADPRTCASPGPAAQPCGPLCTPWCLASHA